MKLLYIKLIITNFVFVFNSFSAAAQYYDTKDVEISKNENPENYIGATLPTDPRYYFKTLDGKDSVILDSYTIYSDKTKRIFTNRGGSVVAGTNVPHFKGTLKDGAMQTGELYYVNDLYANQYHYKGEFKNNRAEGLGILTITSTFYAVSPKICKGIFSNGYLGSKALVKADFDSTGKAQLYYCGDVYLGYGLSLIMNGYGTFYRIGNVKPSQKKTYGVGVANGYYEGQVNENVCTGFGIYNFFYYDTKKISNLRVGLMAADLVIKSYSTLPANFDIDAIEKMKANNKGIYELLPELDKAKTSYFIHNGKRYAGLTLNNKPYGLGIVEDIDGFKEIGFWRNGEKIPTYQLLCKVLPDSEVLKPHTVQNKVTRHTTSYNSKKNKYITEKTSWVSTIYYYGKINNEGKLEGWGWRKGGLEAEAGHFLPITISGGKNVDVPEAKLVFDTAYSIKYGDGNGSGYGPEVEKSRIYTGAVHNFHASPILPGWWILPLGTRDINMIALTEYRDKRLFQVQSWKDFYAREAIERKKKEDIQQQAFDALFLSINNPSKEDIINCQGNFYLDRSGTALYLITSVDEYKKTMKATMYSTSFINKNYVSFTASELLSSGNYRKVQKYITCRSCGGKGTYTNSYSYTADYQYTYGAKVTTSYSKTEVCGCGCGLEPATFGARRDW